MNAFASTDDQIMLADTLRRLLSDSNEFSRRRSRLAGPHPDRMALWSAFAEQGVIAAAFGEARGGFAGDPRTVAVMMAEMGAALAVEPYLATAVIAGRILDRWTDAPSSQKAIDAIIAGEHICVLAHNAHADPSADPPLRAATAADTVTLSGVIRAVRHGDVAQSFLVPTLSAGDDVAFYRVERGHAGLSVEPYRLIDAAGGADLHFDAVRLPAAALMRLSVSGREVLEEALEWGILGTAAETAAIIAALNAATFSYLVTRKQFGAVLGSFQALQHRAADMWIASEELLAVVELAIEAMGGERSRNRTAIMSAAKVVADGAGRRVGNEAVQMHGGMGVSDELIVSHFFRRLAAIRGEWGAEDAHRLRIRDQAVNSIAYGMLGNESAELARWRAEVREFIHRHLPADLGQRVALGLKLDKADFVGWQKILYAQGWFAGAWPMEFGGQGWNLRKQLVFSQESALQNAPWVVPYGVNMVGPVIFTFGSNEQRREHLPSILSSDIWWCQGYSEPGSGSDLASLKTVAVRDGDHYVVNGTKMWTTEAHWADKMHCLVRTDRDVKAQQGISFLLIDMKSPGITISPIVTIDGIHHTNQVFLDNVRVPVGDRVGAEGQGWTIAKFLLSNERTSIADTGPKLRFLRHLLQLHETLATTKRVPESRLALLSAKLAGAEVQLLSLCAMERRCVDAWTAGRKPGADASLLKIRGTEILQALTELAMELEGPMANAHDPADLHRNPGDVQSAAQRASAIAHEYLYARCWSIFGGTNEIQRNIIARQILSA